MTISPLMMTYTRRKHDCRGFLLATLAMSCAGCVGVGFDWTTTENIEMPIPLRAPLAANNDFDRWACQPSPDSPLRTKNDFIGTWGEPHSKEVSAEHEIWTYAESGRWCGIWVAYIVPIPMLLPVCKTYDKIIFENNLAVRSSSRRFVRWAFGFAVHPRTLIPWPILSRAGNATENRPGINLLFKPESDESCKNPPQDDVAG